MFDQETARPMLSDFGLAEFTSELNENSNGIAGTVAYMAPELIEAIRNLRTRDDFAAVRSIASANQLADDLASWLDRPRWNQYFPSLRYLLCFVVAPGLAISGLSVWLLQESREHEIAIWIAIFISYVPLYVALWTSQRVHRNSERARRELWSIWLGHGIASVASMIAIRIQNADELARSIAQFYPTCAAISSVAFFAKSGNFWFGYRWIGFAWAIAAIVLSVNSQSSPILFGIFAAITCITTAWGDSVFADNKQNHASRSIHQDLV